ncbi:MAG: sigma-70 family RNA polymerase sigma factor, partial [bacterium]
MPKKIEIGKIHDVKILDELIPELGSSSLMDRAYLDFARLYQINLYKASFVIRAKLNFPNETNFIETNTFFWLMGKYKVSFKMSIKIFYANLFPKILVLKDRKREPETVNEEQVLIECARNGEMGAFRELVERYKKKIYYLSLDLTGNHHDAEDLSQEVFIKAYRNLKKFRGDAKFNSWLYRIMVNTCISQRRKKSVSAMTLQED